MSKNSTKLSSSVSSVAVNGYAKLVFNFSSVPVGFTLDDIKVTNGVVTNLLQDTTNPLVWTAMFTPGNTNHPNSTIKLDGDYSDVFGNGNPSNTLVLKTDPAVITPTIGFSTNNFTVVEGNAGVKSFTYTVNLSTAVSNVVTVGYTTNQQKGSAVAGADFVSQTGSVTFAAGETSKTFTIDVIGDTTYEGKEYFYVHMTSVTGASLVINGSEGLRSSWVMGNITNDDTLGSVGPSSIYGTVAKDTLGGTSGADVIDGMGGQDMMTGYAGADLFVLSSVYAAETIPLSGFITDFKKGEDHIGLKNGLEFEDLRVEQIVGTSDTMVYLETGESLVMLAGVKAADLSYSDFISIV